CGQRPAPPGQCVACAGKQQSELGGTSNGPATDDAVAVPASGERLQPLGELDGIAAEYDKTMFVLLSPRGGGMGHVVGGRSLDARQKRSIARGGFLQCRLATRRKE